MIDKLLISEPPLQVLPTLVKTVGLNEAIVLQQLHYLLRQSLDVFDNHKWVCLSYDELSAWLGHQVIPRPCGMSDDPGRPYRSGDMGRFAQPDSAR